MKFQPLVLILALMVSPAVAQGAAQKKKKKARGNNGTAQLMRQFKDIEFTDEQKAKVDTLAKEAAAAMKAAREEAGITAEMLKKRAAAQKEIREASKESEKKPAELMKAVNEKAGFTEKHAEGMKKANQIRQKLVKDVVAMLSDEQKAKAPEKLIQAANRKPAKKKGKKSKADNA
ncbi:MAG: hypothetical protein AAFU85_25880 [Planctomycetota bacterium]